jgi:prevent-host-death family protein
MAEWPLQDAKNKFSELVNAALAGEPQRVTRRGQPAVVVLSAEEYDRLCRLERSHAPTFAQLLLEIPQDDQEFPRLSIPTRPLDL